MPFSDNHDNIITFGKHKNKTFSQVYEDTNYCDWILGLTDIKDPLLSFRKYVSKRRAFEE